MFKFSKMTEEEKQGLIHMHKVISTIMPGEAAQAMLHSLGKFLREGACTPEDAADIIKAVFDEEVDRRWRKSFLCNIKRG